MYDSGQDDSKIEDEECEADALLNWRISYDEGARYEYLVQCVEQWRRNLGARASPRRL